MALFRLAYIKNSRPCHATFAAADLIEATTFCALYEKVYARVPCEVSELPPSRFNGDSPAQAPTRCIDGRNA